MNNEALEAAVIGCALTDTAALKIVATAGVTPRSFINPEHAAIWSVIDRLLKEGRPVDVGSVGVCLPGKGALMGRLIAEAPYGSDVKLFAEAVVDRERDRRLCDALLAAHAAIKGKEKSEPFGSPEKSDAAINAVLTAAAAMRNGEQIGYVSEAFAQREKEWEEEHASGYKNIYSGSGLTNLDAALDGGIGKGEVMTLAAKTGAGKSIMGLNWAVRAALRGQKVLFVTEEMKVRAKIDRIVAAVGDAPFNRVRRGPRSDAEFDAFARAQKALHGARLQIVDNCRRKFSVVEQIVRFAALSDPFDLVVIDYIGLFECDKPNLKRMEHTAEISPRLKSEIATAYNCAVLSLAQMNRNTDTEGEKGYRMGNIAFSSEIERDSDIVAFLIREDPNNPTEWARTSPYPVEGLSWIKFEKQRSNESSQLVPLKFNSSRMRFEDMPKTEQLQKPWPVPGRKEVKEKTPNLKNHGTKAEKHKQ